MRGEGEERKAMDNLDLILSLSISMDSNNSSKASSTDFVLFSTYDWVCDVHF